MSKKKFDPNNFGKGTTAKNKVIETKEQRKNFLIICEGARTEPAYFFAIRDKMPQPKVVNIEIQGTGCNTKSLVQEAIKFRDRSENHIDEVWVVFDKDSFPVSNFNEAITMATNENFQLAWSNEAFEIWFLLHFDFISNRKSRDDYKSDIETKINKHRDFNESKKFKYRKNDPNIYNLLQKYGNEAQAIKWAKELEEQHKNAGTAPANSNPCTLVYALVEELNKYI